jgi:hypothetical protein
MGAAGVFAGTVGLQGFAHEYSGPQRSCPSNPQCPKPTAPLVWDPAWCEPFPPNAESKCVKLIFEGLTGFARRLNSGKTECDVGFHSKGDSPISHHLSIDAYSNVVDADNCAGSRRFDQRRIEVIELTVADPDIDQAYFYQRGSACTRGELAYDEDFRWIIDFESDYLYRKHLSANSHLELRENVYSPVLNVKHGIFYTLQKTSSTFLARSEDGNNYVYMSNAPYIMAANVYVKSGSVTLKVDDVTFPIQPPGEIYFKNHCIKGSTPCHEFFNPNHTDKKKRSDFFLNYKAFDRKGHSEYQLHLLDSKDQIQPPNVICERSRFTSMNFEEKKSNDESPCSAAGYGDRTTGLTGSP